MFRAQGTLEGKEIVHLLELFVGSINFMSFHLCYFTVEHNVVYDIQGLSFFIEDGKEENNIVQYNLAIGTKSSSSLLNTDVTPAAFWITNP